MLREVRRALVVALPGWVAARALTAIALVVTVGFNDGHLPVAGHGAPHATGLWAWDAAWYRQIAAHGYGDGTGPFGERFFPLLPLLGRGLGAVLGGHDGIALLIVANLAALGFGAGVFLLTERELDRTAASRATWLTMLAPGAVVLSMAYAEALAGLAAVIVLLAMRQHGARIAAWAVPAGALAGLARPTGSLLAAAPAVEALRRGRREDRWWLAAASAAPVAGTAVYCAWAAKVYDDPLAPYHAQSLHGLRGGILENPLHGLFLGPNKGGIAAPGGAVVAVVALLLLVVVWRRLPASVAVWATLMAVAGLTSARAMSLPRYLSADFPLFMGLVAILGTGRRLTFAVVLAASVTAYVAVALTAFGAYQVL